MSNHQFNQHAGNYERSAVQDSVSVHIENMLRSVPLTSPEHSIFRVRHQLRKVNEVAYEPEIVAIGPYHHENNKFKFMEEQKLLFLRRLLERRNEGSVNRYIPTLRELEQPARNCYAEIINLSPEKFLAMIFIDGCFILEVFRKYSKKELRDENDLIMRLGIRSCLRRDLLLLENQLPLFVLSKLYDLTKGPDEHLKLSDIAIRFFPSSFLRCQSLNHTHGNSEHLLHLIHASITTGLPDIHGTVKSVMFMSPVTELSQSGVRFRVAQGGKLSDIKFENGTLEIPLLKVKDKTESTFRNLIAYEQHRQSIDINYFTDYVTFMDCLINSSKDVELLRRAGIINNYLGDDEVVAQMFNKMGEGVILSNFYYNELCNSVNAYCKRKRNVWMAKLRREYFHSPWAFLSVLAAIVLLLLTAAQTVSSVLSYTRQS